MHIKVFHLDISNLNDVYRLLLIFIESSKLYVDIIYFEEYRFYNYYKNQHDIALYLQKKYFLSFTISFDSSLYP